MVGRSIERPTRFSRLPVLALVVILLLGAALRVYDIGDNPYGFFADEASFGYNAYTILRYGTDEHGVRFPLLFRAFGEYKLPVYIYGLVPFIAVFGLTETAVRLATAAFGTVTIGAMYLLARLMFRSEGAGLLAALVLAVEPWHVHYSRTGIGDFTAYAFLVTAGLGLFLFGRERPWTWPVAAATFGLSLYAYRAAWYFVPLVLIALAVLYRRALIQRWRLVLLSGLILVAMAAPLVWHLVFGPGDRIREVAVLGSEQRRDRPVWETYDAYFGVSFLFERGDNGPITRHYLPGHGQLYWLQAPFLLLGLIAIARQPSKERLLLAFAFVVYPIGGVLTDTNPISSRTIHGSVLFALLTTVGLMTAVGVLRRLPPAWARPALATFAAVLVLIGGFQVAGYLRRYHGEYARLSAGYWGWQWGPEVIVPYFVRLQDQYDDLLLDGEFNAPYIFFRFYAPDDCAKCRIGNTDAYDPRRRQLFALRPQNLKPAFRYETKETLRYPDGEVAFQIVEVTVRAAQ